jgi:hypothetical protein
VQRVSRISVRPLSSPKKEFVSMSAQAYRRYAAECLLISLAVAHPKARALLKGMAIAWTSLADQAEKNLQYHVMCERPQFVVEQQQGLLLPQKGLDFDRLTPEEQRRVLEG